MQPGQLVETYKFWDVVLLWSAERGELEIVVARALARGVIVDGLRVQSVDSDHTSADRSLKGNPYVGYAAPHSAMPVLLRAEALEHLLAIVREAAAPSPDMLAEEFIRRADFRDWLNTTRQPLVSFWFSDQERDVKTAAPTGGRSCLH